MIMHILKKTVYVSRELARRFLGHKLSEVGGTLAYFFLLSIFPFLIFLNALVGFLNLSLDQILVDLSHVAPKEVILLLEGYLRSVVSHRNTGLLSFGLLATLYSASKAIRILISVLNTAYEVKEKRNFFIVSLLSVILTLALGVTIVIMLVLPMLGRNIMTHIAQFFHLPINLVEIWVYIRWLIVFTILFFSIAFLYHFGPSHDDRFRKAIPGTIFTCTAWTLISLGFATYVNQFGKYSLIYGSIGAVIVLMIWFYLTGIILMMGGEINQIFASKERA